MKNRSRSEIRNVAQRVGELVRQPFAVVLIGSVARNCAISRSDVDILVLGETVPAFKLRAPDLEFHTFSASKFLAELKRGDDFPGWCTRFGVPLRGKHYWESVLCKAQQGTWPEWKRKIRVAARRLLASRLSLRIGDKEAAAESAMFAYDHLSRGILLRDGTFPLSRPELIQQIRPLAPELASRLHALLHDSAQSLDFARITRLLLQEIRDIDSEMYEDCNERLSRILSASGEVRPLTLA
jgi:hypothetical protein